MGFNPERFIRDLLPNHKPELPPIPKHDSINPNLPVIYTGDSIILDPSKLPIGGNGYPIMWFGKPARLIMSQDGGINVYSDPDA